MDLEQILSMIRESIRYLNKSINNLTQSLTYIASNIYFTPAYRYDVRDDIKDVLILRIFFITNRLNHDKITKVEINSHVHCYYDFELMTTILKPLFIITKMFSEQERLEIL